MRRVLVAALLAAFAGTACGNLLDPAAAVVYGKKIPVGEVEAALDRFRQTEEYSRLAQQGGEKSLARQFEQGYLSQLVRRAVLEPQAERLGIEISEQEVEEQLQDIKDELGGEKAFQEALREQGLDLAQARLLVRDRALEEEIRAEVTAGVAPDDAELLAYYEENIEDFRQTRASHILVPQRDLAEDISGELQAAPTEEVGDLFADLARQHSTDESNAQQGGDLGWFTSGQFVGEFQEAAEELDVGEISDPVKTDFGYHVIHITGRRTEPFSRARDEIEELVRGPREDEAWRRWLEEAYSEAEVKVNPRYGVFDVASQQIVNPGAADVPGAAEEPTPSPTG